jgi:hypothetical protein
MGRAPHPSRPPRIECDLPRSPKMHTTSYCGTTTFRVNLLHCTPSRCRSRPIPSSSDRSRQTPRLQCCLAGHPAQNAQCFSIRYSLPSRIDVETHTNNVKFIRRVNWCGAVVWSRECFSFGCAGMVDLLILIIMLTKLHKKHFGCRNR